MSGRIKNQRFPNTQARVRCGRFHIIYIHIWYFFYIQILCSNLYNDFMLLYPVFLFYIQILYFNLYKDFMFLYLDFSVAFSAD